MEMSSEAVKLQYNTQREGLAMPEYGRYIMEMAESLKKIEDKQKRTQQAHALVKSMEILNPQVHQQENYAQKLWDHLYVIAGLDLDIDAPFPAPTAEQLQAKPLPVKLNEKPVKAYHYGRNIESIIDLISEQPDGEQKTAMIRSLAIYMRQQYLIWNKDSVSDETIFNDIYKLSDGKVVVPEGVSLNKISENATFSRPGIILSGGNSQRQNRGSNKNRRNNWKNNNRKNK